MTLKLVIAGIGASALTACVSVLPEPEAPQALYSIEAQIERPGLTHVLTVREPEAARLVSGQGLVSEAPDGGLRLVPGVEWAGPATRQMQFAIIDSFKPGAMGNAVAPELGIAADYELASRIVGLKLRGQTAHCSIVVSLIDSRDRTLVARREIQAQSDAVSSSARDRALALSAAASECADQVSAFAIERMGTRP
jgi:cholesterol transport system auxiliary component